MFFDGWDSTARFAFVACGLDLEGIVAKRLADAPGVNAAVMIEHRPEHRGKRG